MQDPGPERWHPDPEFLFRRGAGPLYDIGPYYLSALASVFGPAVSVAAARPPQPRTSGSSARPAGRTRFGVDVPTYVASLLGYAAGAAASLCSASTRRCGGTVSWRSPAPRRRWPCPTRTSSTARSASARRARRVDRHPGRRRHRGPRHRRAGHGPRAAHRRPHRASGDLALHVLETMEAIARSMAGREFEPIRTTFPVPATLEPGWDPFARTIAEEAPCRSPTGQEQLEGRCAGARGTAARRGHGRVRVHGRGARAGLADRPAAFGLPLRPGLAACAGGTPPRCAPRPGLGWRPRKPTGGP